jgi:hypothetical protein
LLREHGFRAVKEALGLIDFVKILLCVSGNRLGGKDKNERRIINNISNLCWTNLLG